MRQHRLALMQALASAVLVIAALSVALALAGTIVGSAAGTASAHEAIVIDHTCTDLEAIPGEWLEAAKGLTFHYAHTSHGSQIVSGIQRLYQVNKAFAVAVRQGGAPALPEAEGALRIYDGNNGETYITPELYWSSAEGLGLTRSVADTGLFGFSMWSWCGQQSSNSVETVQQYLDALDQLETDYPAMRFIYMTGHTDGGKATLERNNDLVRDYVRTNGKVLFDFADIESYDPDGNHYPDTTDACAWCTDWCSAHPEDCNDLPGSCAHSHPFNCKLKGRAYWWMMARLAGWPGPGVAPSPTETPTMESPPTRTRRPPSPPAATTVAPPHLRHEVYLPLAAHSGRQDPMQPHRDRWPIPSS